MDREPEEGHGEGESFGLSRRDWLKAAATAAAVSLGGCTARSTDRLLPLLVPYEQVVPGVATYYATSCRECPAGCGMLIRNREARAVKCEGNPDHPINRGALCARGQAALQGLYDPDRLRRPTHRDTERRDTDWPAAIQALGAVLAPLRGKGRVAVISDLQSGSMAELIRQWLAQFGSERHLVHEPVSYDSLREARRRLFGSATLTVPDLEHTDFLVSFGVDFLETWLSPVAFARQFAQMRTPRNGRMGRFVYVGPRVSITAANADRRILLPPGEERFLALAMLNCLIGERLAQAAPIPAGLVAGYSPEAMAPHLGMSADEIRRLAREFAAARNPLALDGPGVAGNATVESALAAALLNLAVRGGVRSEPVHALSECATAGETLAFLNALRRGEVGALIVIGANPAYSLPPDCGFAEALKAVKHIVHLTPFADETAALAEWVLPTDTPLESWGDYEPQSDVANLMQPVMGRPFDTRAAGDILIALAAAAGIDAARSFGARSFYEFLRNRWRHKAPSSTPFETFWTQSLRRGGAWSQPPPAAPPRVASLNGLHFGQPGESRGSQLWVYPSIGLFDGRGANRRWLQELPDPITKVGWGSWVEMSPGDAQAKGIERGDLVEISVGGGTLRVPALPYAGLARDTLALPLGQGHVEYGRFAQGIGANAHVLLLGQGGRQVEGVSLRLIGRAEADALPCTDGGTSQGTLGIVKTVALSEAGRQQREDIDLPLPAGYTRQGDMYPPHEYPEHRWAMVVDLSRCIGCGACVTACYAENNIGVVGKEQFGHNRHMGWIRIDRYYDWRNPDTPVLFQPMMCHQCDAAPCEPVCPVFASAHSDEGLNMQVYNRCVGTRYCSHNCPYKVRRFNWFDYEWPEPLNWQANPEVTVRARGVMEKCSFCIQRIREAEYRAKRENRKVRDGEIVPACAQTCPTGVLTFGDLMDPGSRVAELVRAEPRIYQVLRHLNTKPAVFYLEKIINDAEHA